jgi:ABC-type phosphate transport system substrate-binding protein
VIDNSYHGDCSAATLNIAAHGSLEGILALRRANPSDSAGLVAFSDGAAVGTTDQLQRRPVAVLIFAVVVNRSVGLTTLTTAQLRDITTGAVRNWAQLGGANLPIRLVGRGADSGSREAFETYVLHGPEAPVSSNSCINIDRATVSPVIRCERQTTGEVLDEVDRQPGAVGYADATDAARYNNLIRVRLDNTEPTPDYLQRGYPFWTIEYAYTNGVPQVQSLQDRYLDYLSSDAAARRLREAAYIPCVRSDRTLEILCQQNR